MPKQHPSFTRFWRIGAHLARLPAAFVISFALGILAVSALEATFLKVEALALALMTVLALAIVRARLAAALVLVFALGGGYFELFGSFAAADLPSGCHSGWVASNPRHKERGSEFLFEAEDGAKAVFSGVQGGRFGYGDEIRVCFEQKDKVAVEGSYSRYLKARYTSANLARNPEVEFVREGGGVLRAIYDLAQVLQKRIFLLLPGDGGVMAKGLLVGGSDEFSREFWQMARNSGTAHLVAVSGYNVSIITIILFRYVRAAFSRRAAMVAAVILLVVFCLMTGASPSILRASLMGALYVASKLIGRRSVIVNSLFAAGLLMLLFNPNALWDIGFQLSFTATSGLIFLGEPLGEFARAFLSAGRIRWIAGFFLETISAQIFSLPILIASFGEISLVAPFANVLILPLVPWAMLVIFITALVSYLSLTLGYFLAGGASLMMGYFVAVIEFFGSLSAATREVEVSPKEVIALYLLIFWGTLALRSRSRQNKLKENKGEP